jgi:hypothetical protein
MDKSFSEYTELCRYDGAKEYLYSYGGLNIVAYFISILKSISMLSSTERNHLFIEAESAPGE